MLLDKIKGNPKRAAAVLEALDPGPAEVPLLLHLGKHLWERVESKEAAVVVLRRADPEKFLPLDAVKVQDGHLQSRGVKSLGQCAFWAFLLAPGALIFQFNDR